VVRNFASMLASQMFTWLLSIGVLIAAPRILGATSYGEYEFSFAFMQFFALAAAFGTRQTLVREIAKDPSRAPDLVTNALLLSVVWTAVLGAGAIGLAAAIGYPGTVMTLMAIMACQMMFSTLDLPATAGFQGLQRMGGLAASAAVQELIAAGVGLLLLWRGMGVVWFAAAFATSYLVQATINFVRYRPHLAGGRVHRPIWRELVVGGTPFFLMAAILAIYGTIDIPILQRLAGDAAVGQYVVAFRWVSLPAFLTSIVTTALYPALVSRRFSDPQGFRDQANKALRLVILTSMPIVVGLVLVSDDIIHLLYGNKLPGAIPVMRILAVHLPLVSITMVIGTAVAAIDRQKIWVIIGCFAAVFNIGSNLVVIPWAAHRFHNGAIGAAIITVATELLVTAGAARNRPPGVFDRTVSWSCAKCLVACAAFVPVVLVLHDALLVVKVAAAAVTFLVATVAMRVIPRAELRDALGSFRRSG
jgi:O-antigen/teichoic acid export membrane protein